MNDNSVEPPTGSPASRTSVKVVPVEFGEAARRAAAAFVSEAKAGDALAPVTLIVPSNYTGLALRRALGAGRAPQGDAMTPAGSLSRRSAPGEPTGARRGIAALTTLTLGGLAERLAAASLQAAGRRPLSGLMTAAVIRSVLASQPGLFDAVAGHHQTAEALQATYRELRDLHADQAGRLRSSSERARGVADICRRVRQLVEDGWYDEIDLLAEAARLAAAPSPETSATLRELGALALYLPRRLSQAEVSLVRALAAGHVGTAAVTVLVGVTGRRHADSGARLTCERLGAPLDSQPLAASASTAAAPQSSRRIVSVTDPDEEVRFVVRSVAADLADGISPQRIAVFYGANEPYGRIFEEQFEAADIDIYGSTARTLAESVYGRFARGLLALADAGLPVPRLGRRDVFDLLAGAKVPLSARRERVGGQFFVPDSKWERLTRAARVTGGADWSLRLADHASELRQRAADERAGDDPSETSARRLDDEADECAKVVAFIDELRARLDEGRAATTWPRLCEWLRGVLHRYVGLVSRDSWTSTWPAWERTAAERVEGVLDRLAQLREFESRIDLSAMAQVLDGELSQPHGRSGTEGRGIYAGPLAGAPDISAQRVYIVGAVEGVLPARSVPDSIISPEERQALDGALARQADATADQHRMLLAALAAAGERCTLVLPRGDLRQNSEHVPSRWLAAASGSRADQNGGAYFSDGYLDADALRAAALDPDIEGVTEVPSYLAGVRQASFPATETEYDAALLLRAAAAGSTSEAALAAQAAPLRDPDFRAGIEMVRGRASSQFTRFDGNLSGVIDSADALAETVSATRLEAWASCPRKYLFEHLLGVRAVEEPEEILRLGPLERGQLMHEAIDRFLTPRISGTADIAGDSSEASGSGERRGLPGPGRPPTDAERDELVSIGAELADEYERRGLTGHPTLWERDRAALLADLGELLDRDQAREAATRGHVVSSEFRFGFAGMPSAVIFELGDGTMVRLRGVIDRVERTGDGGLVVIDYKTGAYGRFRSAVVGTRSRPPDATGRGTMLQLPVYALAAAQHLGHDGTGGTDGHDGTVALAAYWFITSAPGQWQWLPVRVDADLMNRFSEVVTTIVGGIRRGIFPGHAEPQQGRSGYVPCRCCDPDGIGTADVANAWKLKRGDPALVEYAALVEPDEPAP